MNKIGIRIYLLFFIVAVFSFIQCTSTKDDKFKRYCSYYRYENIKGNELIKTEVIFKIFYDEWKSDSILFVKHYSDTVLDLNSRYDALRLFEKLEKEKKAFSYGYTLNFNSNSLHEGQYNLIEKKWIKTGDRKSITLYVFNYYPERDEDDMNSIVFYNPDYGILADYSVDWNNLILLDSIYNNKRLEVNTITDLLRDSIIFYYSKPIQK